MQLLLGNRVVFLGLLQLEFKLLALTVTLPLLVLLPVFDAFLVPLFHKAGIALKFVDLDASHLLLTHRSHLAVLLVRALSHASLPLFLLFKFANVSLHIQLLLRLVQRVDALFEELMLNMVVFFLRVGDLLGWLVVTELASFRQDSDIGRGVDLLKHHFELVEKAEGNASLPLHNLVHHLGVELNVKVA